MTTRRDFLKVVGSASGALVLGIRIAGAQESDRPFSPNAWLTIEKDGSVHIKVGKSEMGQGVRTSLPMIVAEELDADFASVRVTQASPGPDFTRLGTGGSGSIMGLWNPLRQAGAAARTMLVGAAAAKWGVDPTALQTEKGAVLHRASGRRASYGELAADAAKQPVPAQPVLKSRDAYRIVGKSHRRPDGAEIVTGRAQFGMDVRVPGMRFAVVARSPQLGGKVTSFDAAKAKKVAGVRDVFEIPTGIAVVADNTWAAMEGREALTIRWSESPHAAFNSTDHRAALEKAVDKPALTIRKDAAGLAGFDNVAKIIEASYFYPFGAHAALEPVNCTAMVTDQGCTIWSPTQTPNAVQGTAATLLGIPPAAVTVNVMLLGGGFGRRLGVDFDREAVEIARRTKPTPVQLVWTRADDMKHGYFQAASAHRLRAGLDESGKVVAWEHRKASTPHNARRVPTQDDRVNPETVRGWAWGVYDSPYFAKDSEMSYAIVDAPVPIGPWRSVFSPPSVFARECFVDEIARQTNRDPIQVRYDLLGGDETYTIGGEVINRTRMRKVLELVAQKSGWGRPLPAGTARGIACNVFHTETYIAYVVDVRLKKDAGSDRLPFTVDRVVCALDCGVAINPLGVAQQVESGVIWSLSNMKGEVTVKNGSIEQSLYSDFPVVMIDETPPVIETHIVDSPDERPHGLGEPVVCPFAPAVANALTRLVGKPIRELPVRSL
ncbi:MAG TPA: molybdopterin cofactor-binding domain-containing protein [Thermoanaerobaculia bacterium]|nr:molybdopterin cofactor-binding domain-containing protein [Thermoanaerobaculia bacterium]